MTEDFLNRSGPPFQVRYRRLDPGILSRVTVGYGGNRPLRVYSDRNRLPNRVPCTFHFERLQGVTFTAHFLPEGYLLILNLLILQLTALSGRSIRFWFFT